MSNLTIKVDDALLRRARIKALQEGTSVSRVLSDYLERFAGEDPLNAGWRAFIDGAQSTTSATEGGRDWSREDLYGR